MSIWDMIYSVALNTQRVLKGVTALVWSRGKSSSSTAAHWQWNHRWSPREDKTEAFESRTQAMFSTSVL